MPGWLKRRKGRGLRRFSVADVAPGMGGDEDTETEDDSSSSEEDFETSDDEETDVAPPKIEEPIAELIRVGPTESEKEEKAAEAEAEETDGVKVWKVDLTDLKVDEEEGQTEKEDELADDADSEDSEQAL